MAAPFKRVCLEAARTFARHRTPRYTPRQRTQLRDIQSPQWHQRRCFTAAPRCYADANADDNAASQIDAESDLAPHFDNSFYNALQSEDQEVYKSLSPAERKQMEFVKARLDQDTAQGTTASREVQREIDDTIHEIEQEVGPEVIPRSTERKPDSFWNMGEAEDMGPDDEFNEDEISSIGHGYLEEHRELREMMRIAAWEMPLLSRLSKRFRHPNFSKQPLRWRYTTYLGEHHPASRKVVVEFEPENLENLTDEQRLKMKKIAGPRYNPTTGVIKMSCESFETQAQNKRYLGDTIQKLIGECTDTSSDSFVDVPLDVRHQKVKPRYQFPKEWIMTPQRKELLRQRRGELALEASDNSGIEGPPSGVAAIEQSRQISLEDEEQPMMAEARIPLPTGKMGQKEMGQTPVQR